MKNRISDNDKFIRLQEVTQKIAIKKSKIYQLINDGLFPKPVKIGTMSRWIEREVTEWMVKNLQ
jgi:prophage regulatory protein